MTIQDVERLNDFRWMREQLDCPHGALESLREHLDSEIAALERALEDFEREMDTLRTTKGRGNAPCLLRLFAFNHFITMTKSDQRRYPPLTLKVAISRLKFWADKVAELAERPPVHQDAVDTINDTPEK